MKPRVLQLNPILIPAINEQLASLYCVHKLFETADQDAWLNEHGASIDAVITGGHTGISRAMLQQLPRLKVVAVNGVGTDAVDLAYCRERGLPVTATLGALTEDVARSGHRTADCRLSQPVRR
jgi:lactate dehydrogenase-like 2-hydroxyacid dehydrogenase